MDSSIIRHFVRLSFDFLKLLNLLANSNINQLRLSRDLGFLRRIKGILGKPLVADCPEFCELMDSLIISHFVRLRFDFLLLLNLLATSHTKDHLYSLSFAINLPFPQLSAPTSTLNCTNDQS